MKLVQQAKQHLNTWAILSLIFIFIIIVPNLVIGYYVFLEPNENWYHIKEYLLKSYVINTLTLVIFTGIATIMIGTSLAWFVTVYQFPLRNFFKWALILPLAIPPYIAAYTYQGMLNYTGIIQSTLRNTFDIHVNQKYFNIMSIEGAIFIFTMFLFPYVYSVTRAFFQTQSASVIENARILGASSYSVFFRMVLPISRAAVIGGVILVILEVLNDYGVANFFGLQTFSTAIFRTWFGLGDLDSALKLAGSLMIIVIFILVLEKLLRGKRRYNNAGNVKPIQPQQLKGVKAWLIFAYCSTIFSLGFLIPFLQLTHWVFMTYEKIMSREFITLIWNSIFVATVGASIIVVIALIVANYTRLHQNIFSKVFTRVISLGYSIPGAAIAVAVITIFILLDDYIYAIFALFGKDPAFILRTSLVMLIAAYIIRFLAIGFNSIEAGFEKTGTKYTEASRSLGYSVTKSFFRVDAPMIKGSIISAFILVFIDILKELPLTLFLQPFNFSTLATKAFQYANDEMVNEAAIASMFIILISAVCIYVFHKVFDKSTT